MINRKQHNNSVVVPIDTIDKRTVLGVWTARSISIDEDIILESHNAKMYRIERGSTTVIVYQIVSKGLLLLLLSVKCCRRALRALTAHRTLNKVREACCCCNYSNSTSNQKRWNESCTVIRVSGGDGPDVRVCRLTVPTQFVSNQRASIRQAPSLRRAYHYYYHPLLLPWQIHNNKYIIRVGRIIWAVNK